MNHNIKFFILFTLFIFVSLLFFPLNAGAQSTYCIGDEVWEDGTMIEDCNFTPEGEPRDICIGTTFRDYYCFYGSCTYADLACNPFCDSPPPLPTLVAPPHNIIIDYVPTFKVQVSDSDNDDVRAHFRIVLYGTGAGNWVESGGISEWGPVNIGDCAIYEWEAYTEDACGFKSNWTGTQIGYWVVKVDKGVTSSTISYVTGTISQTTFWVYLEESGGCSGVAEGNVDVSIDGGAWQDHANTIYDFQYTGSNGHCYKFQYQVKNSAGEWSDWDVGGEVCIQVAPVCDCASGPCCDGCNFDSSSIVCQAEAEEEFQCTSADCGGDYQRRTRDQYCSGDVATCTGSYGSWSSWSIAQDCSSENQRCSLADGGCIADPTCACVCLNADDPCCDGCNFESSSIVCQAEAEEEFQCTSADCGGDYQRRTKDQYCSGNDVGCTGSLGSWSGWEIEIDCYSDSERCSFAEAGCIDDSTCVCVCSSSDGPCCTDNCNFDDTSTVCQTEAETEYQCSGAGCGDDYQKRIRDKYCSGSVATCTGSYGSWSGWTTEQDCADSQLCSVTSPYCQDDPSCASCECSSGPCCDGCNFKSSSTVCDTEKEYQCSGTGCGADYQSRTRDQYCSGNDVGCTGSLGSWSDWVIAQDCSSENQRCSLADGGCIADPTCEPEPEPAPSGPFKGLVPCGRCEEWECEKREEKCPEGGDLCNKEDKVNVCVERNYNVCVNPPSPGVGDPCQLCHFFVLAKNLIDSFLIAILAMATFIILLGGILILTGGGSPEAITKGKKAILFAVIGIIVAFGAWVIINSLTGLLVNPDVFPWPWNKIPLNVICPS